MGLAGELGWWLIQMYSTPCLISRAVRDISEWDGGDKVQDPVV